MFVFSFVYDDVHVMMCVMMNMFIPSLAQSVCMIVYDVCDMSVCVMWMDCDVCVDMFVRM